MNIEYLNGSLEITGVELDPQLTLMDSAQVFHWSRIDDIFYGTVCGRRAKLTPLPDGFRLDGVAEKDITFWRHYFDLDRDYRAVMESCKQYPHAYRAMQLLPGMRVLNQPAWEATIAFILSANNNVARIRQLVGKLIGLCGENGGIPSPEQLGQIDEATLRGIGCGYRAPFLVKTTKCVLDGLDLDTLRSLPYDEAHKRLLLLPGVGDKVADCIQLFGLGQGEAFPVDVWVERLMVRWFLPDAHGKKEIRAKAQEMFGVNAGIIQQSLFHCARLSLISLE